MTQLFLNIILCIEFAIIKAYWKSVFLCYNKLILYCSRIALAWYINIHINTIKTQRVYVLYWDIYY